MSNLAGVRAEQSTRQRITKVNYFTLQTQKVCGDAHGYRLMLSIWHLARRGHCKWSLFMTNNSGQYLSHTLFGMYHVRGKERTVFLTSGEEKLSYSIFSLVLYLARIMLEVKSVQFTLHQGKRVKLQHYFSFSYFVSFYSARIMLGVRVYSFPFIRVGKLSYSILKFEISSKNARVQLRGLSLYVVCILF